jgi:hypothetical protein
MYGTEFESAEREPLLLLLLQSYKELISEHHIQEFSRPCSCPILKSLNQALLYAALEAH